MSVLWERQYARRTQRMGSSLIRELLKLTARPEVISFGGGLPAPEVFPVEAFRAACDRVLREHGPQALQYSITEGYPPLRRLIAEKMAGDGVQITEDNILITSGSQQALDIIGRVMLDAGDIVLTEEPTFLGALQAWSAYQ
ncbi:MAG TPA: aminotransferase, partial [Anaerolineae bacterium]|nr:aminotransferase [Anaerolineae bacterium]